MSDTEDKSEKTEDPTAKRLQDAREKGQVANSKEVNTFAILLAGTVLVLALGRLIGSEITAAIVPFLERPHAIATDFPNLRRLMLDVLGSVGAALLVAAAILMAAAAGSGFLQHGPVFSAESLKPDLSKLSLIKGLKRQFSVKALAEFTKGIVKIAVVTVVVLLVVLPEMRDLELLVGLEAGQVLQRLFILSLKTMGSVVAAMAVIAGLDFIYQRYEFTKQQRMSKREIKEEHKQLEGDPMVKARLRSIRMEKARRRMMAAVPEAQVVITNPTHYAVALRYDETKDDAPVLVAKGADLVAQRIRDVALENQVPLVENPPLCRALFQSVEIDQIIPVEHYKAVAEVIGYVWRLRGKVRAAAPPAD